MCISFVFFVIKYDKNIKRAARWQQVNKKRWFSSVSFDTNMVASNLKPEKEIAQHIVAILLPVTLLLSLSNGTYAIVCIRSEPEMQFYILLLFFLIWTEMQYILWRQREFLEDDYNMSRMLKVIILKLFFRQFTSSQTDDTFIIFKKNKLAKLNLRSSF